MKLVRTLGVGLILVLTVLAAGTASGQVEPIGGPYVRDSATVMLLHFDNNFTNDSYWTSDAVLHTKSPSKCFFFPASAYGALGSSYRLGNDAQIDSSYITVADDPDLDLLGNWTIEGWMFVSTFGEVSTDWRWVPRLCIKPGDQVFWQPNWWVELWGDNRWFQVGFFTGTAWPAITSAPNVMQPGEWVHLTFIRDNDRGFMVQMVHDANLNMRFFGTRGFNPATEIPITNSQAVHIGWAGAEGIAQSSGDSWLDGFVDEVRISNVVRNFAVPPIFKNLDILPNQRAGGTPYTITASIIPFNSANPIQSVYLRYRINGGAWDSVAMSPSAGDVYTAMLPSQVKGARVDYYATAFDVSNNRVVYPTLAEDPLAPTINSFRVYEPNLQVLHLTFEENGAMPVDHSSLNLPVVGHRIPDYSTDAKEGTYSLLLQNNPAFIDSNWVEVDADYELSAPEFCVDMWLNADSSKHATRILNLPEDSGDWNNNNYEISLRNNTKGVGITGRYFDPKAGGLVLTQDTSAIVLGKWYHVIYERNAVNGVVALVVRDENDQLVYKRTATGGPPQMGGVVNHARLRVGRAATDAANYWFIAPFRGKLDNIKIYNYPFAGVSAVGDGDGSYLPNIFELGQNYPNPFNPTTRIRFVLPQAGPATLVVYDVLGRKVKTLFNENTHAGEHFVSWDGTNSVGAQVASGFYVYRLVADDMVATRKMMFMK